ncbi:MAG: SpoIID/LytB domain-containing protein [Candidatus Eisenbacteria bacterium]
MRTTIARLGMASILTAVLASCAHAPNPAPVPAASPPPISRPAPPSARPVTDPPSPASRVKSEPTFDIGLATDLDSLRLEPEGEAILQWRAPDGPGKAGVSSPIDIVRSGAQVLVWPRDRDRAVPLAILEQADTLWLGDEQSARVEAARMGWNGKHWRGRFKVFLGPRGKLTLVTRLSLEHYLLGVVPGEIGALRDSLLEAGRAQAVAARSYSLFYRGRRASEGFDLYASVEDQVYGPLESERPLATRCVQTTAGLVALSNGSPIRANYCSTCGGITAEAWEAWPTGTLPYLGSQLDRGVGEGDHCASSPQYRWREEWTAVEFIANVTRFAPQQGLTLPPEGLGQLVDVSVAGRSRSGRVWRLRVETTQGEMLIPAYVLRQVLRRSGNPASILRSNLFKIAVRRESGSRRALAVVASGAGFGHGVGLCQTGALAMARGGANAKRILTHYYNGADLERLY